MEINPIDKIPELIEMLKQYNPVIRSRSDEGYDWLEEDSFCIEIPNPVTSNKITIECGDYDEFTVCFSYFHSHYLAYDYAYNNMCEQIMDILNNKYCSAAIFCENQWQGSSLIDKEKASLPIEEIFDFVFENTDLIEKLRINGGEARFDFWDSNLSKIVKI